MAKIKIVRDEVVFEGAFIRTIKRYFKDKNGHEQVWEMVERKNCKRIVVIAAITPEKEIILEKIYRVPFKNYVIELPAGLMDIEGEPEESAARRELLEETGYAVDEISLLDSGPFNTGLLKDELAVFLGLNAVKIKEPELESSEDIAIIKVPLKNLLNFLAGSPLKHDVKIPMVLAHLAAHGLSV